MATSMKQIADRRQWAYDYLVPSTYTETEIANMSDIELLDTVDYFYGELTR